MLSSLSSLATRAILPVALSAGPVVMDVPTRVVPLTEVVAQTGFVARNPVLLPYGRPADQSSPIRADLFWQGPFLLGDDWKGLMNGDQPPAVLVAALLVLLGVVGIPFVYACRLLWAEGVARATPRADAPQGVAEVSDNEARDDELIARFSRGEISAGTFEQDARHALQRIAELGVVAPFYIQDAAGNMRPAQVVRNLTDGGFVATAMDDAGYGSADRLNMRLLALRTILTQALESDDKRLAKTAIDIRPALVQTNPGDLSAFVPADLLSEVEACMLTNGPYEVSRAWERLTDQQRFILLERWRHLSLWDREPWADRYLNVLRAHDPRGCLALIDELSLALDRPQISRAYLAGEGYRYLSTPVLMAIVRYRLEYQSEWIDRDYMLFQCVRTLMEDRRVVDPNFFESILAHNIPQGLASDIRAHLSA